MIAAPGRPAVPLPQDHPMSRVAADPGIIRTRRAPQPCSSGAGRARPASRSAAALVVLALIALQMPGRAAAAAAPAFGFEDVTSRAKQLAKDSFKDPRGE